MALNGVPVIVVPAAAFSCRTLAEFSIARRGQASNYLSAGAGRSQTGGERSRIVVPTVTLDSLLERFDPPTFIKVDVEGAEIDVFQGAQRILAEVRPTVYYEAAGPTVERCREIFIAAGYGVTAGAEMNFLAVPH